VADWTPRVREAVYQAARSAVALQRSRAQEKELQLRLQLESAGMQFEDLSQSERETFRAATSPVIDMAHAELDPSLFEALES
jgi:TRAP-type C4-dicarboxylate transport system substrate-binding protein